ncbi:hypothetical protein C7453_1164 [Gluconacetobacter liquefaciens]|uniref:Uncharacterized protein n=1 Tax=Gluconacetobacter liquefaciens TaxID=89584 RepID=A0A370FV16_GLULI|nr:hypothetical protein C7453_1164 [Gluconacetobacter liquefaciens]
MPVESIAIHKAVPHLARHPAGVDARLARRMIMDSHRTRF